MYFTTLVSVINIFVLEWNCRKPTEIEERVTRCVSITLQLDHHIRAHPLTAQQRSSLSLKQEAHTQLAGCFAYTLIILPWL